MTDIVVFHHVRGLTPGIEEFAGRLRQAGHTVHTPDLFEGRTFGNQADGIAHAREIGFGTVAERGRKAADALGTDLVYAGFSLGVLPAQELAQTRAGARGALLLHGCFPPEEFGGPWPEGVPVQIHAMADDPEFVGPDQEAAEALVASAPDAELFLYPGSEHLFTDSSVAGYDAAATALLTERVLALLARV